MNIVESAQLTEIEHGQFGNHLLDIAGKAKEFGQGIKNKLRNKRKYR